MKNEIKEIEKRYDRRLMIPRDRYSFFNNSALLTFQERQRVLIRVLREDGIQDLSNFKILEIGCGSGANLLELLILGARPENLVGNELLQGRIDHARRVLPEKVTLLHGDASSLNFENGSFDIVYQSTVFTSILEDDLQRRIADRMWQWLRPGGAILWYDFTFNNPKNPDVRGVSLSKIRALFPNGKITHHRLTLAPPIARLVTQGHPILYSFFNLLPFLRTHVLCYIKKP